MQVQTYISFGGRCEEALAFYKQAVGAEIGTVMRWKDSPDAAMKGPPGYEEKIMHVDFKIGATTLMADDGMGPGKAEYKGFTLSIAVANDAEAKPVFDALGVGDIP